MIITAKVDSAAWEAAMNVLLTASEEQAREASLQGAEEIKDWAQELLSMQAHGPHTRTPSAPGTPPALISGALMASMTAEMVEADTAWVGPTSSASSYSGPYGRIQELGGDMYGHGRPMKWLEEGRWHSAYHVYLPPRPYLGPATTYVVDSGRLTEIYTEHQLTAIEEATG